MSASVRFVGTEEHGVSVKPSLGVRGTKYATCIINDGETIRAIQVPLKEFDKYQLVHYHGKPYPVERFIEKMLAMTTRRVNRIAITQAAREAIERAQGATPDEEPTPEPAPSEPKTKTEARTLLATVCAELKLDPAAARRTLRKAGLHAPYTDENLIRKTLA